MDRILTAKEIASSFRDLVGISPLGEPGGSGECWKAEQPGRGEVALKQQGLNVKARGLLHIEVTSVVIVLAAELLCGATRERSLY